MGERYLPHWLEEIRISPTAMVQDNRSRTMLSDATMQVMDARQSHAR